MPFKSKIKARRWRKEYREKNKEMLKVSKYRGHLRRKYNFTPEKYNRLLKQQRGVCAICGSPPVKNKLAVDHDHKTGKVRGLLCLNCNLLIGRVEKNPCFVSNIIKYLKLDKT